MRNLWSRGLSLVAAVVLPVGMAAALVPLRQRVNNTNIALILVAIIVAVAATGGRSPGLLAAMTTTLSFDFFHTQPYESFTITRRTDIETAALLLVVGPDRR